MASDNAPVQGEIDPDVQRYSELLADVFNDQLSFSARRSAGRDADELALSITSRLAISARLHATNAAPPDVQSAIDAAWSAGYSRCQADALEPGDERTKMLGIHNSYVREMKIRAARLHVTPAAPPDVREAVAKAIDGLTWWDCRDEEHSPCYEEVQYRLWGNGVKVVTDAVLAALPSAPVLPTDTVTISREAAEMLVSDMDHLWEMMPSYERMTNLWLKQSPIRAALEDSHGR